MRFIFKEGWRNFRNLGIYGLLTLISLTMMTVLILLSAYGYLLIDGWKSGLMSQFEIEAFLADDLNQDDVNSMRKSISAINHVESVKFISKEMAAARFAEQFDTTLLKLLEFNPLPPSFIVSIKKDADHTIAWASVAQSLKQLKGVEEVVYQGELLNDVMRFYTKSWKVALCILLGALTLALVFCSLTVTGEIKAREEFIRIIALSGGTRFMARGPFVAMGVYYGIISNIFAFAIAYGATWVINFGWGISANVPILWLGVIFSWSLFVAIIGASLAAGGRIRFS